MKILACAFTVLAFGCLQPHLARADALAHLDQDNFVELNLEEPAIEIRMDYRSDAKALVFRQNKVFAGVSLDKFTNQLSVSEFCVRGATEEKIVVPQVSSVLRYPLRRAGNCVEHFVRIRTKGGGSLRTLIETSFDLDNRFIVTLEVN